MPIWEFLPDWLREERNVQGTQYQLQRDFQQQQQEAPNPIGEAFGALGRATEPMRGLASGLLELSTRPGRAVRSGIHAAATGQDVGAGIMEGLGGGGPENFAGMFEQGGMGTQQLGPFDTRGILGFGLDIATDPLSYVPFGKVAGVLRGGGMGAQAAARGAAQAGPLARSALSQAPRIGGLGRLGGEVAEEVVPRTRPLNAFDAQRVMRGEMRSPLLGPEPPPPPPRGGPGPLGHVPYEEPLEPLGNVLPTIEGLTELGKNQPLASQVTEKLAGIPLIGRGIRKFSDLISENILAPFETGTAGEVKRILLAQKQFDDVLNSRVHQMTAQLRQIPGLRTNDRGQIQLADKSWYAAGDVFENLDQFRGRLRPEDIPRIEAKRDVITDLNQRANAEWRAMKTELEKEAPDAAKHFTMGPDVDLATGQIYQPRATISEGQLVGVRRKARSSRATHGHAREITEQQAGIEEGGLRYAGMEDATEQHLFDKYNEIGQMQTIIKMKQSGISDVIEKTAVDNMKEMRNTARAAWQADRKNTELKDVYKLAQENYRAVLGQRKMALDGLKETSVPFMKGLWFQPDEAAEVERALARVTPEQFALPAWVSNTSRTLMTTMDIGGAMIQGIVGLVVEPQAFIPAYVKSIQTLARPETYAKYMASPKAQRVLEALPELHLGGGRNTEQFAAAAGYSKTAQALQKIPGLTRFQGSYEAFGDVLRVEWADALLPVAQKKGPQAIHEMTNFINHATGAASTAAMGISPAQRALESTLIFAPRYTRSALALIGDMLGGGEATKQSGQAIAQLMSVGVMEYTRTAQALGQEPVYDPKDARFLTVQIGEERVGPGSVWIALARTLGKSFTEPDKLLDPSDPTNPLIRFFRGRTAPATGIAWDVAMHESFMGEPLYTAGDYMKYLGSRAAPMALGGALIDQGSGGKARSPQERAIEAGAGFLGLRAYPRGFTEIREEVAGEKLAQWQQENPESVQAIDRTQPVFEQLDPFQQVEVGQEQRVKELPLPTGARFQSMRERQDVFDRYRGDLNKAATEVAQGRLTRPQFREIANDQAGILQTRLGEIEETGKPREVTDPREIARNAYYEILKERDVQGRPDFDKAESYFYALDPQVQKYIKDKQLASYGRLDADARALMEDLWAARQRTKPYWQIKDQTMERLGIADDWDQANPLEKKALEKTAVFKRAAKVERERKQAYRRAHPEVDADLVAWWDATPIAQQGTGGGSAIRFGFGSGGGGFGGFPKLGGF